jgi:hypothetical protein
MGSFVRLGAQPLIRPSDGGRSLGRNLLVFEDVTASLTIREISSPGYRDKFTPSAYDVPNFNVTRSAIWAHFRVELPDEGTYYIQVDPPSLREATLFTRQKDGSFTASRTGIFHPLAERDVNTHHFMFRIRGVPGDTLDYYLRVTNFEPLQINLTVGRAEQFISLTRHEDAISIFCFGLVWMMMIYNFYLFATNRDRTYLYYVMYVLFNFIFTSCVSGYVIYYPRFVMFIVEHVPAWNPALLGLFGSLFAMRFLNTRERAPRGHKAILGICIALVVVMAVSLAGYHQFSIIMMEILGFVFGVILISTGITVLRRGYRPAVFFLCGYGCYLVSLCVFISSNLYLLPVNAITMNSLQIGTCLEILLFSFALGDKMNTFKNEKEKATEDALRASLANEKLVREQNALLEVKVKERTLEIEKQKNIIEEKNKDITSSIMYAKRIQQALMPTEVYLDRILRRFRK